MIKSKSRKLLIIGFSILLILMILMSFILTFSNNYMNQIYNKSYNSFSKWVSAEEVNTDVIALHKAMKDVVLSRDEESLNNALKAAQKYDAEIKHDFDSLRNSGIEEVLLNEIINYYNDWSSMREDTIAYTKDKDYEKATENNVTIGGGQVDLICDKIQLLIEEEKRNTQSDLKKSDETSIQTLNKILGIKFIEVILALLIALFVIKKITKYEMSLHEEKEELKITFDSIGDGVITTDTNSRVIKLNKVAETLTGWKTEEAYGKPFSEVFIINNEITGEKAKDPVLDVLTTDRICELENHTILTSKNGDIISISDSAAPIKQPNGKTIGVVMVFRDVTEKKKYQNLIRQSEEHYRMLFNSMLNGYAFHEMICDDKGNPIDYRFVDINPAFEEMTGLKKSDCIGKTIKELLPNTEQYWIDTYGKVVETGDSINYENYSKALGKYFIVYAFRPIENHFSVIIEDITERRKLENAVYEEKEQLRITFDSIGDGVITTDINKNVIKLNKVAEILTGWKSEEAFGKPFSEVFEITNEMTGARAKDPVVEVLTKDIICELENHTILTSKEGIARHIADSAAPIKDKDNQTLGVVVVFRDVTEKKAYIDNIKYLSYHDSLTGLYNRAYFEDDLKRIDNKDFYPISIIMGDVNGLKLSNDVYGHKAGDELLKAMANIFREICGEVGIISRLGGDEFAVILPNTTNSDANIICNQIKSACDKKDISPIILSISLGVATKEDSLVNINQVLKDAEDRMYTHKLLEGKSVRSTIILSLQKTLFERSFETEEHASRMLELTNMFGEAINLRQYEIDEMKLLTLLHDVGKIGIPDNILNKKEKLTNDEWSEMKKHPEIGFRIAQSTAELAHISDLILTHHEHWDGNGYPQGLKGDQIPKLSRILAIIDAYDVMTNGRPYKEPVSKEEALKEIKRCSGTQFDPDLVEVFVNLMK